MNKPIKSADDLVRPPKQSRRFIIGSAVAFVLVAALGVIWMIHPWQTGQQVSQVQTAMVNQEALALGISASGTTALGSVQMKLPSDLNNLGLTVDSVSATVDGDVQAGEPLLTIAAESLAVARESLQTAVHVAQGTYDQAAVDYKSVLVKARDELSSNQQLRTIAEQDHAIALFDLQSAVDQAKKAMDEAHRIIADYPGGIAELTVKLETMKDTLNQLKLDSDNLKKTADAAQTAYQTALTDQSKATAILDFLDHHGVSSTSSLVEDAGKMLTEATAASADLQNQAAAAAQASNDAVAYYNNLKSDINHRQTRIDKLEAELASAQANLAETELSYYKANLALIRGKISLDESYQTKLIDYSNAKNTYDLTIQRSQASFDAAKLALETAKATLATFEDTVGSGSLLATGNSKVSALGFAAGDLLTSSTPYATLISSETVTIPLTVDQTKISLLSIGDPAQVTISQAVYQGEVISIQPTSSSTSMSNVYYTVTVEIKGDLGGLSSDMSADVILNPQTSAN